ncbi:MULTISPECIES: prolipoprotein diacylglyceryl transferase [Bacillaceae]|uniref:prolipoprotein diacylglyceryl transferase n=1 Tax=Bacillaceae TaxID=186817 RepID=UPI000BFC0001|nr:MULTISPECIES: prolipoprotein diacylglyceryl transferase [Bacillaceae]MCM3164105.1 prolipoprotein diacylglyceryl transferase [Metabacillus litoralis]PGT84558.1 prolipoprotein diacylglyceryl transferase [Bacillus sp. AFS040349]UGB33493.1 prolipoprotein diacylglyceryl transferase [Metabacillus sp. B2-18]
MKPLFSFGPFTIHFFGLMIAIGAIAGILLFIREAKRRNMNHKLLLDGVMYSLFGGILGARIFFILFYNPSFYFANPMEVFFIQNGGLSIHGGIIGGVLVGYLFLKKHKLPIWQTLDVVAPSLILAQGISRIGCDVFGGPIFSVLPWGIEKGGELLHPAQAYEFLLDYLLFGYLWLRLKKSSYTGQVFLHYLIGYLAIRAIVEFARINPMVVGPFSVSHVMSLVGIIFAIFLMRYCKRNGTIDKVNPISKNEFAKTGIYVISLMIISLLVYYGVQG